MTLSQLITQAYAEDIPKGDLTTDNLGLAACSGDARLVAKEDLVLAGRALFVGCVKHVCPDMVLRWQFDDGDFILDQQTVCWLKGDLLTLLKAERVALNFLGHLSGIATLTRCFAQAVSDTECKILDTRKTTPLLREYEKAAVRAGGGHNHRMNLSDAVLIKENHIRASGGLERAVRAIKRHANNAAIEVECSNLDEVALSVSLGVERILLDNMNNAKIAEARAKIPPFIQVEASGNMRLERVGEVARLGVDFISVGALTHSAPCADFSLLFEWPHKN